MLLRGVREAIVTGAREGATEAWTDLRIQAVLAETDTAGFDEAFVVADRVPGWFGRLSAATFWAVIQELRPRTLVEIGSYLGRSTVFTAEALGRAGIPDAVLHAIDPHTGDRQHLDALGLDTVPTLDLFRVFLASSGNAGAVQVHVATSVDALAELAGQEVDFVFVDGWHQYDAVLADVTGYGALLSERGVMCIDDVRAYEEVDRASREGLAELGLVHYGDIGSQAWAGRRSEPPASLRRALRLQRSRDRLATLTSRDRSYRR